MDVRFIFQADKGYSEKHPFKDDPGITKYYWKTEKFIKNILHNTNWSHKNVETESVQIGNNLYIGISYHNSLGTETLENRLYLTTKASW